jgi:hypothetical protein
MKISAFAFLAVLGLSGCMSENYGFQMASTDCSSEGRQKPIAFDNGAGTTWKRTNTSRWCAPHGGMPVSDDPIFEGSN